jgi:hypothetical protein
LCRCEAVRQPAARTPGVLLGDSRVGHLFEKAVESAPVRPRARGGKGQGKGKGAGKGKGGVPRRRGEVGAAQKNRLFGRVCVTGSLLHSARRRGRGRGRSQHRGRNRHRSRGRDRCRHRGRIRHRSRGRSRSQSRRRR